MPATNRTGTCVATPTRSAVRDSLGTLISTQVPQRIRTPFDAVIGGDRPGAQGVDGLCKAGRWGGLLEGLPEGRDLRPVGSATPLTGVPSGRSRI